MIQSINQLDRSMPKITISGLKTEMAAQTITFQDVHWTQRWQIQSVLTRQFLAELLGTCILVVCFHFKFNNSHYMPDGRRWECCTGGAE
jgi:hypothetical protein